MIELYRGSVNTWECDEIGHMNVRFYVARQMEGLAIFAHHLGMPHLFHAKSVSTVLPFDQHIRFMREVLPGRPIYMEGGVLDVTDDAVLIYQELKHSISGETSAAFRTWFRHVDSNQQKPFKWSQKALEAFEKFRVQTPPETRPRSIDFSVPPQPDTDLNVEKADTLGVPCIGRMMIGPRECDTHGRLFPEYFIGRVSESVPNLLAAWRDDVAKSAEEKGEKLNSGGVVLEYRLAYRHWPSAGELIEIRTGLGSVTEKTHSLIHWCCDPISGKVWCSSQAVAITLDLDKRKAIPTNKEHIELLKARIPEGLAI